MRKEFVFKGKDSFFDIENVESVFTVGVDGLEVVMNGFSDLRFIENLFVIFHV